MEEQKSLRHTGERESIQALKKLCRIHAYDSSLHAQLAEKLYASGREVAALVTAQKAYGLLEGENPIEAGILAEKFGSDVMVDDKHPPACKMYLPLMDIFGKFQLLRRRFELKEGDILYKTGDKAEYIYLVLEGELSMHVDLGDIQTVINYLHAGSLFGKSAMQENKLRFATAVAMKDSILVRFSRKELNKAFSQHPNLEIESAKEDMLRKRVGALSSIPLMSRLSTGVRFLLASRSWHASYQAGASICSPELPLENVLLLVKGELHLHQEKNGESIYCGRLNAGNIFGLQKIISPNHALLSVVAEQDCEVLWISFDDIKDLMDLDSDIRQRVENIVQNFASQIQRTVLLQANPES